MELLSKICLLLETTTEGTPEKVELNLEDQKISQDRPLECKTNVSSTCKLHLTFVSIDFFD